MRSDWDNAETAKAWADAVAEGGDVFHHFILKPYLAAALCSVSKPEPQTSCVFYKILANAFGTEVTGQSQSLIDLRVALEASIEAALIQVGQLRVLDIGGGEGFVGRWLAKHCSRYAVIDVSRDLIKYGIERTRASGGVTEFLLGDLNSLKEFDSFDQWLEQGCEVKWRSKDAPSKKLSLDEFDVVLCNNVLDHLTAPAPFLARLAKSMGQAPSRPPLILSTLNPDFFVGAEQWPQRPPTHDGSGDARKVRMGPASRDVTVIPRGWMVVEYLLNAAKFNILCCDPVHICQYPAPVQEELMRRAGLDHYPAGGPFLLWHLSSAHHEQPLSKAEAEVAMDKFEVLREMSPAQRKHVVENLHDVTRVSYAPFEPIAFPSNLPHGFFLVEKGEAEMVVKSGKRQVFGSLSGFGELETGRDVFVSRFLYPVRAGAQGCTAIRIGKDLVADLLESEDHRSLGSTLFDVLRGRVSTYSWVYHRPSYISRDKPPLVVQNANARECENLARLLLFACTMEGGQLRKSFGNAPKNNGLSVLIKLPAMREAVAGASEGEKVRANERDADETSPATSASKNALYLGPTRLLHAIGAIDVFDVQKYTQPSWGPPEAKEFVERAIFDLLYSAIEKVLLSEISKGMSGDPRAAERIRAASRSFSQFQGRGVFPQIPLFQDQEPSWEIFKKQIVRSVSDGDLSLSSDAREFADALQSRFSDTFELEVDHKVLRNAIGRLMYNFAFVRNEFFNRRQARFFVINDMYLLRRIAVSSSDWIPEVLERAKASPYVFGDRHPMSVHEQRAGFSDVWRFHAYLNRFKRFAENYWDAGLDLVHTHDAFFQDSGLVQRALNDMMRRKIGY